MPPLRRCYAELITPLLPLMLLMFDAAALMMRAAT